MFFISLDHFSSRFIQVPATDVVITWFPRAALLTNGEILQGEDSRYFSTWRIRRQLLVNTLWRSSWM